MFKTLCIAGHISDSRDSRLFHLIPPNSGVAQGLPLTPLEAFLGRVELRPLLLPIGLKAGLPVRVLRSSPFGRRAELIPPTHLEAFLGRGELRSLPLSIGQRAGLLVRVLRSSPCGIWGYELIDVRISRQTKVKSQWGDKEGGFLFPSHPTRNPLGHDPALASQSFFAWPGRYTVIHYLHRLLCECPQKPGSGKLIFPPLKRNIFQS